MLEDIKDIKDIKEVKVVKVLKDIKGFKEVKGSQGNQGPQGTNSIPYYTTAPIMTQIQLSGPNVGQNNIYLDTTADYTVGSLNSTGALSCSSLTVNGRSSAYTMYCGGRVGWNGTSAVKDFVATSSQSDFTVSRSSQGNFTVTYSSGAHPSGGVNYVVNVTGYSCVAILRSTSPPTTTTFTVAL